MTLILQHITTNNNNIVPINQIIINYKGIINYNVLSLIFNKINFTEYEFNNIKFYINNLEINNSSNNEFNIVDHLICYIYTSNINIKNKIINLGNNNNNNNNNINNNNNDDNNISNINKETLKLFNDPDFKKLVSIYLKKPELLNLLYLYVENGDVIDETLLIPMTDFNINNSNYIELIKILSDLNINYNEQEIINIFIKYNGHLNLVIRTILTEYINS